LEPENFTVLTALLEALGELRGNFPAKGFGRLVDGWQPSQASLQALGSQPEDGGVITGKSLN
jgi:hypothetical protein